MSGPLKIGLVGAGRIAAKHIQSVTRFADRLRYTAVCDIDEQAARRGAAEAGADRVYTDYARLIREADIDAVDICTVADTHAAIAIAAAEAGRHVLVEKPMGTRMSQCRDMVAAAGKSGVTLMVAHNQRYMANYRAVRRVIREGELGTVRAMRIESLGRTQAAPGSWVYDAARAGGGVVISLAVHRIDLARFFIGDVRRVSAICRTTRPEFIGGAEDYAWARMEFECGAVGDLFTTWSAWRVPWGESFLIHGDAGTVHALPSFVKYHEPCLVASTRRQPPPEPPPAPDDKKTRTRGFVPLEVDAAGLPTGEMYVDELLHFEECCRTGQEPVSSGRDNLGTMAVVFGIYESARRDAPVDLRSLG